MESLFACRDQRVGSAVDMLAGLAGLVVAPALILEAVTAEGGRA